MGYAMDIKDASETYRLVSHTVNNVTFYILEIDSWCDVGILVVMWFRKDCDMGLIGLIIVYLVLVAFNWLR